MLFSPARERGALASQRARPRMARPAVVVAVCALFHLLLGAAFSLNTPLWESYDENGHYAYARYIAAHGALPPPGQRLTPHFDESHQPPLYYALIAPAIAAVDTSDEAQPRFAPGPRWGVAPDRAIDRFPYRGTALALRLARLLTLALSSAGVALTFVAARSLLPGRERVALLATALYALWPMFLFLSGVVSNDPAISVFGSLTLAIAAGLWARPDPAARRWLYAALALCLAGAALTKDSAIALFVFAALFTGLQLWRDHRRSVFSLKSVLVWFLAPLLLLSVLAVIVSDGRVLRQFDTALDMTAGVLTAAAPGLATALPPGLDPVASIFQQAPAIALFVFRTTIGTFGWGTVSMPEAWYVISLLPAGAALAGIAVALRRRVMRRALRMPLLLLGLFVLCVALAPFVRAFLSLNYSLLLGRFLMPALSGIAILAALGLESLPRSLNRLAALLSVAWIGCMALMTPWVVLLPAYRPPALLDPVALPDGIQVPQRITFGDSIQLLGHSFPRGYARADEVIPVTLYWRALRPVAGDYLLVIDVYDVDGRSLQTQHHYTPGNGTFPTGDWKAGDTFAETYPVWMKPGADLPTRISLRVSWRRPDDGSELQPVCEAQPECGPLFGALPIHMDQATARPWQGKPAQFRLGDIAEILELNAPGSARAGDTITLTLVWRALTDVRNSYTAFVHVISDQGELIAQHDSVPRGGRFPTGHWLAGDIVPDQFPLPIRADAPPGLYRVKVGLYETQSRERLSAYAAGGALLPDGLVTVRELVIEP